MCTPLSTYYFCQGLFLWFRLRPLTQIKGNPNAKAYNDIKDNRFQLCYNSCFNLTLSPCPKPGPKNGFGVEEIAQNPDLRV